MLFLPSSHRFGLNLKNRVEVTVADSLPMAELEGLFQLRPFCDPVIPRFCGV